MSNYLYKGKPIENYLVDANGASGTIDYKITHMVKTAESTSLDNLNYKGDTISYLKKPSSDFRFVVSEELKDGYNLDGFVDKLKTPYLPIDDNSLSLRFQNHQYQSMLQVYKEGSNSDSELFTLSFRKDNDKLLLKINSSSTESVLQSPIVYLLLQAGGGTGGLGAHNQPVVGWATVGAGGAGGSGAAALICLDVEKVLTSSSTTSTKLFITKSSGSATGTGDTLVVVLGNNSSYYIGSTTDKYLILYGGRDGGNGVATFDDAEGGKGGKGGTYSISKALKNQSNISIICTAGTTGKDGCGGAQTWDGAYRAVSGNTSRGEKFKLQSDYTMSSIKPYSISGTLMRSSSHDGIGEPLNDGTGMFAGGPGGAPSPLCPGKSHNRALGIEASDSEEFNWPGSGGVGQSGWAGMANPSDLQKFNYGGPAAAWLIFMPTKYNLSISIAESTWSQAVYPGASGSTLRTDKVAVFPAKPSKYISSGQTLEYILKANGYTPSGSLKIELGEYLNADCVLGLDKTDPSGNTYKLTISNATDDVYINITGHA